jgi:hypothetical protein
MPAFSFSRIPPTKKGSFPALSGFLLPFTAARYGWRLIASLLLIARLAPAQEALRNSTAGDAAAEATHQQISSQDYTVKEGDFRLLVTPSLEFDWNNNVGLSKTDQESDFILQPLLQLTASYPLTERNLLSLTLGVGYNDFLKYSENNSITISSSSQLAYDIFIKDFKFDIHDRIAMTDDPSTQPAISGTSQFGTLVNTAGLTTTWDLEDVVLSLGYDHQNTESTFSQFNYLDSSDELIVARAGLHFSSTLTAGVEATASYLTYAQEVLNNSEDYTVGVYGDYSPDSSFHVEPRFGYSIYQFQQTSESAQVFELTPSGVPLVIPTGEKIQTQNVSSWYASLTMSHQITKAINYSISLGHEVQPGIQSDLTEDYYFRPAIDWMIIKDLSLTTSVSYDRGTQGLGNVSGSLSETYEWWQGSVTVSYPLVKKLSLSLNYRYTLRSSNISVDEYAQNVVGIRLTYPLE